VHNRYYYQPFGQASVSNSSIATWNSVRFTGRDDDGTGLYFYRARYYSPDLGRFISEDPAGLDEAGNQYAYAGDDPVNAVDPSGLVHVVGSVDSTTRFGTAKVYANKGDYIPPSPPPGVYGPFLPTIANGGELLLTFNISNRPEKGYARFPADTWVISGV
jgi:RHS repeat-associated protein